MGLVSELPFLTLLTAFAITLFAGFIKGMVGFAMPLIMISGLATVLPAEVALAALIIPTVVTNTRQALRHGPQAALEAVAQFKIYLGVMMVMLLVSAQFVTQVSSEALFVFIGVPIVAFCVFQLSGWIPNLRPENRSRDESIIGAIAGITGGVSGVWGPPTVAYLTAINTPKAEQMRVQGVIYGLGAVLLVVAHLKSGVFNAQTAPLSVVMLVPALVGMWIGGLFHDRLPQAMFKRATLVILTIAGLNLIRKGIMG